MERGAAVQLGGVDVRFRSDELVELRLILAHDRVSHVTARRREGGDGQ